MKMSKFFWLKVMKSLFGTSLCVLALSLTVSAQTGPTNSAPMPLYENFSIVDTTLPSPQIDALAFANYGTFIVTGTPGISDYPEFRYSLAGFDPATTILPYDFQNTLNFTNQGTMSGVTGFRFDTVNANGIRRQAASFVNAAGATISASTYIQLSATNVQSHGLMTCQPDSLIQIKGQNVDLTHGGFEIQPLSLDSGICFFSDSFVRPFLTSTNFFPDRGIYDRDWDVHTNALSLGGLIRANPDGTFFVNGPNPIGILPSANAYVLTNSTSPTNIFVQAVFVQLRDSEVKSQAKFVTARGQNNNPPLSTPIVLMTTTETNVVTDQVIKKSVYLMDRLASQKFVNSETNLVLLANADTGNTFMPSPYRLSRIKPCEFDLPRAGNANILTNFFEKDIFYSGVYSNSTITNVGSFYSAFVDKSGFQVPAVVGGTVTNRPGRIEIESDDLDMSAARMRGEGIISIKTRNLVASKGAKVYVDTINYDLGSKIGELQVKDLAEQRIRGFDGVVNVWSGVWSNETGQVITNVGPDPANPMATVTNVTTNVVEVFFHAVFIDNRMQVERPVSINDLTLRSTNVSFADKMQVTGAFNAFADTFTMERVGSLALLGPNVFGGRVRSWTVTNSPSLRYLTNNGTIQAYDRIVFGTDRTNGYASVVNNGNIVSAAQQVRADYFENTGQFFADSSIQVEAKVGTLDGGSFQAGGNITLAGGILKLNAHSQASVRLAIDVSDTLTDSGDGANNSISTSQGFNLITKPLHGDLLGTTFSSSAARFTSAPHTWAAEDRGATVDGFTDNAAIGKLILDVAADADLTFSGRGAKNALYVDRLEISPAIASDLAATLRIQSNLVIYFADANVPVEELDGQLNGHLRWVKDFAGPSSGIDVLTRAGKTVRMNRSLRNSAAYDSDGDGIYNRDDLYPLDPDVTPMGDVAFTSPTPFSAEVSIKALAQKIYQVEYATDLAKPNWKVLSTHVNPSSTDGIFRFTITDPLPAGQQQRYYRVRLKP